jgi:hypothetical protein
LQTIRAGIIAGLTEWKNRKNSGMIDAVAQSLADVTILSVSEVRIISDRTVELVGPGADGGLLRKSIAAMMRSLSSCLDATRMWRSTGHLVQSLIERYHLSAES